MGAYGHVLLCQAFNVVASREPGSVDAYPMLKTLRRGSRDPGYALSRAGLAGGEIVSAHVHQCGISSNVDYAWI
jgi:hypothetical protein